jgi:Mn2+/Fe2+ NRAMP family transporter
MPSPSLQSASCRFRRWRARPVTPSAKRCAGRTGVDKKLRDAVCFYTTIILSVAIAVLIDFLKIDPIQSLFWSAIVNGVLAPFLLVGILLSARDPRIMKKQPSSVAAQAIVGVTTLAMFGAAGVMLWSILQGG